VVDLCGYITVRYASVWMEGGRTAETGGDADVVCRGRVGGLSEEEGDHRAEGLPTISLAPPQSLTSWNENIPAPETTFRQLFPSR
jgi:hypothetical protein